MQGHAQSRWATQTSTIHVGKKNMEVTVSQGGLGDCKGWEFAGGGGYQKTAFFALQPCRGQKIAFFALCLSSESKRPCNLFQPYDSLQPHSAQHHLSASIQMLVSFWSEAVAI